MSIDNETRHDGALGHVCEWCGGEATEGTTCPRSLTCGQCHAGPGVPCKRPSGHRADVTHWQRIQDAEDIDAGKSVQLEMA